MAQRFHDWLHRIERDFTQYPDHVSGKENKQVMARGVGRFCIPTCLILIIDNEKTGRLVNVTPVQRDELVRDRGLTFHKGELYGDDYQAPIDRRSHQYERKLQRVRPLLTEAARATILPVTDEVVGRLLKEKLA